MSVILAIDTSTNACSAALLNKGELIQEISLEPRSHTRLLLEMVDKVLSSAQLTLAQLDAIAYTSGPGSFTGLRIGMGVVQGLAFGADLPVVGISTLQALSLGAVKSCELESGQLILPAFDARMGEIYWGCYRLDQNGLVIAECDDQLTPPEIVGANLSGEQIVIGVGEGWQFESEFPVQPAKVVVNLMPEAKDVALLAEPLVKQGKVVPIEQAELVYLRDTVSWKKRERLRK